VVVSSPAPLAVGDLPLAIAVVDADGAITSVAQPFADLAGRSRDELVGLALRSLVAPDDRTALDEALAAGSATVRVAGRRGDGLFFVADLTVGGVAGSTERVVSAVAGPATPLAEGDPAIDRETRGVVDSALSHDVRGALRGVNGFLAIFDREVDAVPDKLQGFLDTARRSALTADTMADQLLRYIRIGRRPFAVRTLNLRDVFVEAAEERDDAGAVDDHTVDRADDRATELDDVAPSTASLDVEVGELVPVVGNRSMLLECVAELLVNAAKFGATRVVVTGQTSEGWLYVRVADDGPGVDPELADDAFRLFRLLQPKGRFPGVGAGLAVARQIAEVHGGGLWIEPADEGTTVVLRLLQGTE
jgi:PAS domain S-box-containing protein